MTITARNYDPPTKAPLVDPARLIASQWQVYFTNVAKALGKRILVEESLNPPSIAAGDVDQATATVPGIRDGDFCVAASFAPGDAGIRVTGQVTADNTVTVTFENVSGSPIDLGAGTLRLLLETR